MRSLPPREVVSSYNPFEHYIGPPMTLGNMRENNVRSLAVSCDRCHHDAVLDLSGYLDDVPVPTFGPRMICTRCARQAPM